MYALSVIIIIFVLFLAEEYYCLKRFIADEEREKKEMNNRLKELEQEQGYLLGEVKELEDKMTDIFFFYDLTRKLAPILDSPTLLKVFFQEIKPLGELEPLASSPGGGNILKFKLADIDKNPLWVKTASKKIIKNLSYFSKLLSLCLERISLYNKLQQMSIYDSLTGIYNRRYFMARYVEEFKRAEKFRLNLSFLMLDIDNFKVINDTYGHLVGDVVLKEVARLTQESLRQIDLIARFGGEEFSLILLDTDKDGAIMVAERIRSKVAQERIKAFDEMLNITISAGAASYPYNTFHSDLLIEIADKALYKAKMEGKNRVCCF